jgi:hypothetical protein
MRSVINLSNNASPERNLRGFAPNEITREYTHALPIESAGMANILQVVNPIYQRREAARLASAGSAINRTVITSIQPEVTPQANLLSPTKTTQPDLRVVPEVPQTPTDNGDLNFAEIYKQIDEARADEAA